MKILYEGALPSQHINHLLNKSFIKNAEKTNIKPASLDLTITDEIYKIPASFQVPRNSTVRQVLGYLPRVKKIKLSDPLEIGSYYLVKVKEEFDLPSGIYGYANPKSTTGRLDMHVRLFADHVPQNDAITSGFVGELWVSIKPQSFSMLLHEGVSLNQMRLFYSDARLNRRQLEEIMQDPGLLFYEEKRVSYKDMEIQDSPDSIVLRFDGKLGNNGEPIGYMAKKTSQVIEYNKKYKAKDFFTEIFPDDNGMTFFKKDCFSILSSVDFVSVPEYLACEMASIDDRFGEFRSHYAGFIDPGWTNRPLTLEVRPFEDVYIRHNQPVARIKYEFMAEVPDITYDEISSNYIVQNKAKLAKQFY